MAVFTTEIEIASSVPAIKLFKAFGDFDTLAPKVDPQGFKSVTVLEGDGGVGTVKSVTFGDGVPYTNSKLKMDVIDVENLTVVYTIFEGDALLGIIDTIVHHMVFEPSADGGSVYKHKTVLNCKADAQFTDDMLNQGKEAFKNTFKGIEAYVIAHPEAY